MTDALYMPLLFTRDVLDPIPELTARRETEPVSILELPFGIKAYLVTGYDAAKEVLGDATTFSNAFGNFGEGDEQDPGGLGMTDPPYHTKLRRLLTPEFTMRRLQRLQPRIEAIIAEQLDAIEAAGAPADLVHLFALPIPSLVICELLGVPYSDRDDFQALSTARFDLGSEASPLDTIGTSLDYLQTLVLRERADPGEGLLGMLIREHGDELTDRELAGIADGILTGGHETTASSLSLGVLALLQSPEYFAQLAGADGDGPAVRQDRDPDRRRDGPRRADGAGVTVRRRPGRHPGCGGPTVHGLLRPDQAGQLPPGLRVRDSSLRRRRVGQDGAARGVPRVGPSVPDPAARRPDGGPRVPQLLDRLQRADAAGGVVTQVALLPTAGHGCAALVGLAERFG